MLTLRALKDKLNNMDVPLDARIDFFDFEVLETLIPSGSWRIVISWTEP